jgi:hypothetical protein
VLNTQQMSMVRGEQKQWNIAVTQAGVAVDLTGRKLIFTAKLNFDYPDSRAVFQKSTTTTGIALTDAVNGLARLTVISSDTDSLPYSNSSSLFWDLRMVTSTVPQVLASGTLVVSPNVTRSV